MPSFLQVITSAKVDTQSSLFVCLLATSCKTSKRICMKFSGKVGNGPVNNCLNFSGDPDHHLDILFSGFVTTGRYGKWYQLTAPHDAAVHSRHCHSNYDVITSPAHDRQRDWCHGTGKTCLVAVLLVYTATVKLRKCYTITPGSNDGRGWWLPEVNSRKFSTVMLASSSQKLIEERVRLVAKEPVCHVQLVRLTGLVECRLDVSERLVKMLFLHVGKVQHVLHLWLGRTSSSGVRHRQGNGDAERWHEDVRVCRWRVKLVHVKRELRVRGRQAPTLMGVLKHGCVRHLVNIQLISRSGQMDLVTVQQDSQLQANKTECFTRLLLASCNFWTIITWKSGNLLHRLQTNCSSLI